MGWTLGNTRIFVVDETIDSKNIIARLQPLAGGSVHQTFGYENDIYKVNAYIVGSGDLSNLKNMAKSSSKYALKDFDGNLVLSGYVNSISTKVIPGIWQSLRLDLPSNAPVYVVEILLYE